MLLHIIAAANRQPAWADQAFAEYAKRLTGPLRLKSTTVRLAGQADVERAKTLEGERLLKAAGNGSRLIALEESGEAWSTRQLAAQLEIWMRDAANPCFLIGGPDGHAAPLRARADVLWSLSPLTLPHALVRVVAAEALYRAASVLAGHPYHRE